jgi:hypothetical protein
MSTAGTPSLVTLCSGCTRRRSGLFCCMHSPSAPAKRPRVRRPAYSYRHSAQAAAAIPNRRGSALPLRCLCHGSTLRLAFARTHSPMDLLWILTGSCPLHG